MSWSTSLLLALVLWLDGGLRKVPSDSIVLRRSLFGEWRIIEIVRAVSWRAIGRWPSIVLALVPAEPARVTLSSGELGARLSLVRVPVGLLRAIGIITSIALVVCSPIAVSRMGRSGLYYASAALLVLGLATALASALACRRLGLSGWTSIRFGLAHMWPFAGPWAAERMLGLAIAGASPVDVARALTGSEFFARWARPHAHDALAMGNERYVRLVDGFAFTLERGHVHKLLTVLPENVAIGSRYCPRCGASFRDDVRACADCTDVALVTAAASTRPGRKPVATTIRRKRRRKR